MGKNKKLIVMLGVFIAVFLIAIFVFPYFKQGYLGDTEDIVVANKIIKQGELLTKENTKTLSFPSGYYDKENALTEDKVLNQYATQDIYEKDVITTNKVSTEETKKKYITNTTAVTLKTLASGVAGDIKAGDIVKVYGALRDGDHAIVAPEILGKMEVIDLKKSDGSKTEEEKGVAGVVIFATNSQQAKALIDLEYTADIHLERLKS